MSDERSGVEGVEVRKAEGLTLRFTDGFETSFGLEELRVNCPCAACRVQREQGRAPWPPVGGGALRLVPELAITDAELVGAWGISLTWSDGHSTGIYPWEALRRWADERAAESAG